MTNPAGYFAWSALNFAAAAADSGWLLSLAATGAAWLTTTWVMPRLWQSQLHYGPTALNYKGHRVAAAGGLVFPLAYGVSYSAAAGLGLAVANWGPWWAMYRLPALEMMLLVVSFTLWGLLDDVAGETGPRGWRGHGRSLRSGPWSSGVFKIVGAATAVPPLLLTGNLPLWSVVPAAAVVALTANTVNQLDVRPGRALRGLWLLTALAALPIIVMMAPAFPHLNLFARPAPAFLPVQTALVAFLPLLAASIAFAPWDFSQRVMLGDAGANALGAGLGLLLVHLTLHVWPPALLILLLLLGAAQWAGDRWSWSQAICVRRRLSGGQGKAGP